MAIKPFATADEYQAAYGAVADVKRLEAYHAARQHGASGEAQKVQLRRQRAHVLVEQ